MVIFGQEISQHAIFFSDFQKKYPRKEEAELQADCEEKIEEERRKNHHRRAVKGEADGEGKNTTQKHKKTCRNEE